MDPATSGDSESALLVAAAPVRSFGDVLRRFWPDARPYRGWILLGILLASLTPLIEAATIWLYGRLVDEVLVPRDLAPLATIAGLYLALTLGGGLLSFANDYVAAWTGERLLLDLRLRVFRHLLSLPPAFFHKSRLGDLLARLTEDVDEVEAIVVSGASSAISAVLKLVFFVGALLLIDWRLTLVALVVAPPCWYAARRFAARIKGISREQRQWEGALASVAEEILANAALVQAHNRQEWEARRFAREAQGDLVSQLALERLRAIFSPLVGLLELVGVLVVVAFGALQLINGALTLGELLMFLAYLSQLYGPVRTIARLAGDIAAATASGERVLEVLEAPVAATASGGGRLKAVRGEIRFEDVSFHYPGALAPALSGISFTAAPGQTVAVVGPSGAGKSTIVSLLLRFADPDSGRIALDGEDLRDLDAEALREAIAVVLQETLLFDGSVRDNIAYGRLDASDEEIAAAARAADANDFIRALPDGYQTRVGQRGRTLSGGQRQRIAIARALLRDAPILILDEPTTGLDEESAERILAPLRRLMAGRTTLLISHDPRVVAGADQTVAVVGGRVAATADRPAPEPPGAASPNAGAGLQPDLVVGAAR